MIETNKAASQSDDSHQSKQNAYPAHEERKDLGNLQFPVTTDRLIQKIRTWNEQALQEGWSIQMPGDFSGRPALQRGCEILQDSGHVIVGMSLGNSYFSPETISRLFRFLHSLDVEVYVVVMDKPSEHNFRALGYSERRIADKVKQKGAQMFRAIRAALEHVNDPSNRFHILDWSTIRESKDYQNARLALEALYRSNTNFRNELRAAVSAFLTPKLEGATMSEERHINADQYLLEELAFLMCSRDLIGDEASAYLYHREWPIFERLVSGALDKNVANKLGFVELRVQSSLTGFDATNR